MDRRSLPAICVIAGLSLLLHACGTTTPDTAGSPTPDGTTPPASSPVPTSKPTSGAVQIEIEDGEVIGPVQIAVQQGQTVALEVSADVEDEVHVHAYDVFAEVSPGETATFQFKATIPGVFDIELENAGLLITRLKVTA